MPTDERFFSEQPIRGVAAALSGPEAHHLIHVLRAKPGDRITVFDGSGREWTARIEKLTRAEAILAIADAREVNRELRFDLTLAVALPKGDRQKWLVEKATELGIARLVPLRTERAVAQPSDSTVARLRRTVVEASKQCGRNRLMQITEPSDWAEFLQQTCSTPLRVLAHPAAKSLSSRPATLRDALAGREACDDVLAAIGPEGGFTDAEAAMAIHAGWIAVDLGPRILRIETAALAVAAIVAGG